MPLGPTHGGAWPRRPAPSPRFPPLRGASHLSIFCCQLANARGLPRPAPRAPRVPSPTPGEDALVPAPHRNPRPRRDPPGSPRFPPGGRRAMPCHAMLDGRLGGPGPCSVARCQATVRLPLRCATKRLDASPPRPRAVAPVMPCHAMPSHPPHRPSRTTPMQTHRPSLASNRARKRSAVPTRFSGGTQMHTRWATTGQPAKSSAPLPRCQLARTGAVPPRGPGSTTPPPAKSSAPLQCCQLAKGRAH